jgi:RNA polymerase sigma-70 factor (ECF subfamily)
VTCLSTPAADLSKPPCSPRAENQPHLRLAPNRNGKWTSDGLTGMRRRKLWRSHSSSQQLQTFEELLLTSRPKFVGIAYAILRNREDAEDAIQNASLSAFSHLRTFEGRSAFTTWFTRIVMNAALMIQRKRKSSLIGPMPEPSTTDDVTWADKIPTSQPDPEVACAEQQAFQLVDTVLDKLTPGLRQAFTLRYYDELSDREACVLLGVSVGTFKSRVLRARRLLLNQTQNLAAYPIRKRMPRVFSFLANDFPSLAKRAANTSRRRIASSQLSQGVEP